MWSIRQVYRFTRMDIYIYNTYKIYANGESSELSVICRFPNDIYLTSKH